MNLEALKTRLADIYPGDKPLDPEQLNAAWQTLSTETESYEPAEYRVTALTLAADLPLATATRVIVTLRTVAALPEGALVDEMLRLMRTGNGVDVKNPKTAATLAAIGVSADDVAAVVAMGNTTRPKFPGLTIDDLTLARSIA